MPAAYSASESSVSCDVNDGLSVPRWRASSSVLVETKRSATRTPILLKLAARSQAIRWVRLGKRCKSVASAVGKKS